METKNSFVNMVATTSIAFSPLMPSSFYNAKNKCIDLPIVRNLDERKNDRFNNVYEYNKLKEKKGVLNLSIELTRNINKLSQIRELVLENSNGRISFSSNFTKSIAIYLFELKHQPEIFPNFFGNIQLEYKDKEKYLEIEVTPDLKMNIFKIDEDGKEFENDIYSDFSIKEVNKELDLFYGI